MRILLFFIPYLAFSTFQSASAQEKWTTEKRKNGVEVQVKDAPGWPIKTYRAWVSFNGNQQEVIDYMLQWEKRIEWNYALTEIKVLHQHGDETIVYWRYDMPWPVEDRDLITKIIFEKQDEKTTFMRFTALPDYIPRKTDCVRIEKAIGYYRVVQLEPNIVEVASEAKSTTGGEIPSWVANMFIVDSPYETLKALKEHFLLPTH
ncbi:MAG: hypothetical protein KDC83_01200 [Flavobacteriales bacterium]|nr:hypothetical protein [Flavobacteriales bacterium]